MSASPAATLNRSIIRETAVNGAEHYSRNVDLRRGLARQQRGSSRQRDNGYRSPEGSASAHCDLPCEAAGPLCWKLCPRNHPLAINVPDNGSLNINPLTKKVSNREPRHLDGPGLLDLILALAIAAFLPADWHGAHAGVAVAGCAHRWKRLESRGFALLAIVNV
jgi:hypothetical protein